MPFDWKNFLILADELARKFDEASKRTAISRAYYCVFNLAITQAVSNVGPRPQRTPSHKWCWEQYIGTPDLACRQLGIDGQRMMQRRRKADYDPKDNPRLDDDVLRMLEEAHQFVAHLAGLDPKYPRRP